MGDVVTVTPSRLGRYAESGEIKVIHHTHTHTARAVSEDLERVRATIHRHAAPDFHALSHHWSNVMTTSCSIHIRARRHATKL